MTRILAWNVNHRAAKRQIPEWVAPSILATSPDVVVLTEYVQGPDHVAFIKALELGGLGHVHTTNYTPKENQVLIASRNRCQAGEVRAPAIYSSVPLNALHVVLPAADLNVLGFRMPSGKNFDAQFRRPTSDWVIEAATRLRDKPSILIGDFNIAPGDAVAKCGDFFDRMSDIGWFHAMPSSSAACSFRHTSGTRRAIDHCFVSPKINCRGVEYRWDFQTAGPTPRKTGNPGVPDHAMLIADVEFRVGDDRT